MPGPQLLNPGPLLGSYDEIDRARGIAKTQAIQEAAQEYHTKLLESTAIPLPRPSMEAPTDDPQAFLTKPTNLPGPTRSPVVGAPAFQSPEHFAQAQQEASTLADTTPLNQFTPIRPGFAPGSALQAAPVAPEKPTVLASVEPRAADDWALLSGHKPKNREPVAPTQLFAPNVAHASYEPTPYSTTMSDGEVRHSFNIALGQITSREGMRTQVYKDQLGNPTVGVGHLVRPEDNLKVGETISKDRANVLLNQDARSAYGAAQNQMKELGIDDPGMLEALTSVNFQLGSNWNKDFNNSWNLIKAGRYQEAAAQLTQSDWYKQTPDRVRDFQHALIKLSNTRRARG